MTTTWTKPAQLLSINRKCGSSIDLPIKGHCTPTTNCAASCYARVGFQAFPNARRKQNFISQYLKQTNPTELIKECKAHTSIRLNGSGDLNQEHLPALKRLAKACPNTTFWGMTRKPAIAKTLNKLQNMKVLVSIDASSPTVWKSYKGPLCYGPRLATDTVPSDPRILTVFPKHTHGTVKDSMPNHPKDCPAVRHKVSGCLDCERCFSWKT